MLRMQLLGTAPWFSRSPACRHVRRGVCKAFKASGVQFGSGPGVDLNLKCKLNKAARSGFTGLLYGLECRVSWPAELSHTTGLGRIQYPRDSEVAQLHMSCMGFGFVQRVEV